MEAVGGAAGWARAAPLAAIACRGGAESVEPKGRDRASRAVGALLQGQAEPCCRRSPCARRCGRRHPAELAGTPGPWQNASTSRQNWPSARPTTAADLAGPHRWRSRRPAAGFWPRAPSCGPALCRPEENQGRDALNLVSGRGCWGWRPPRNLGNGEADPHSAPLSSSIRGAIRRQGHTRNSEVKQRRCAPPATSAGSWTR